MERIEATDYYDIVKPSEPRLSPDGTKIAFVRRVPEDEESYDATIYIASTDGATVRRFTLQEGVDAAPRWSPSGDRLAFTSTRGAADDRQQLWVLPVEGGEARQVTDVIGGVTTPVWAPDGQRIAFCQRVTEDDREADRDLELPEEYEPDTPDPRVVDRTVYRSGEQFFDGQRSQVYQVELDDDTVTRVTRGDADFQAPEWGDKTTLYMTESIGDDPDDSYEFAIHAYDTESETAEQVHKTTGWGTQLTATDDGRIGFVYASDKQMSLQQSELRVLTTTTGDVVAVTDTIDRTLGLGGQPQWGPDQSKLYFTTPDEGAVALWQAPGDGSSPPERVCTGGTIDGVDIAADPNDSDQIVALTMSQWDHPGDLFVYTDGQFERITQLNEEYLTDVTVGEPQRQTFHSEQGPVDGWTLVPPDFDSDETYPLIVEIHGGPHAMWSTAGTMWHEFQALAARGYVVLWTNPRGSSGYGEEYMQAIERDWGSTTLTDVLAAVRATLKESYVDEENVFVTGGSFGGFMTAWTVGETDQFDAAVAQRGVYDLTGFYGSTDGAYKLVEGDFDTTPWDDPAFLWEHSPVSNVPDIVTPTLVLHSEDDYRTPMCTAELFYRGLRKHDVDTRLVRYPREGHELSRSGEPGHIVDRIERIARWFDGYSDHHNVPIALERGEDGLSESTGEEDSKENQE